jgi:hypothetical protein
LTLPTSLCYRYPVFAKRMACCCCTTARDASRVSTRFGFVITPA